MGVHNIQGPLDRFPMIAATLAELLNSNPCEPRRQAALCEHFARRCDMSIPLTKQLNPDYAPMLQALKDAALAYDPARPDESIARILGVCALLDIEVHS